MMHRCRAGSLFRHRLGFATPLALDSVRIYDHVEWRSSHMEHAEAAIITLSTTKVEYIALTAAAREILYLQLLIQELYHIPSTTTPICYNN